jgi:glycine/D-amino acid oxidase-like deaminating enzyme
MNESRAEHVAVVGAGIVGAFIGLNLVKRGVQTVVIDAGEMGGGASANSFAAITALEKEPRDHYLLHCHGIAEWRRWGARFGPEIGLRWGSDIRWTDDPEVAERLRWSVRSAREHGYPVRMMPGTELAHRLPAARPGPVLAASYAPEDGHVEPLLVSSVCERELEDAGARLLRGRAAQIHIDDPGAAVVVGDEVIRPDYVVLAAGAESAEVAARAGLEIPTIASSALVIHASAVPSLAPGTVQIPSPTGLKTYLRHKADGTIMIGEESTTGVAPDPSRHRAEQVLQRATRYFPALRDSTVLSSSVVWRSMPADHLPIVGQLPGLPSLYIAVMHGGVTLAPAIGELAAREIVEGEEMPGLASFRPGRFSDRITETMLEIETLFGMSNPPE